MIVTATSASNTTEPADQVDVREDSATASSDDRTAPTTSTDDGSIETPPDDAASSEVATPDEGTAPPDTAAPAPIAPSEEAPADATYPTLPDGSPAPVIAIFDVETVTLWGEVPDQESSDYLAALALGNSKFPDAVVANELVINPNVPLGVGVRVIELNSVRFPASSDEILPEHAAELDRAVGIMELFPHVSVLVIGHADQRGSAEANYEISGERADAVVEYMISQGVDPARLASRAVGADDLIALDNDEAAFALNRRTEFVFYGLLIQP